MILLESRPASYQDRGYYFVSPNGLAILEKLGVYDIIRPGGFSFDGLALVNEQLNVTIKGQQGTRERFGFQHLFIARGVVHKALKDKAAQVGVDIRYEAKCEELVSGEKDSTRSTVKCTDGRIFHGDVIVGADGIKSMVRAAIGEATELVYSGFMGVNTAVDLAKISLAQKDIEPGYLCKGQKEIIQFSPCGNGKAVLWVSFEYPDRTTQEWGRLVTDRKSIDQLIMARVNSERWHRLVVDAWAKSEKNNDVIWP